MQRDGGGSGIVNFKFEKGLSIKHKVVQTGHLLARLREDVTKKGCNNVIRKFLFICVTVYIEFIKEKRHKRQYDAMPHHSKKHKELAHEMAGNTFNLTGGDYSPSAKAKTKHMGEWFEAEDIVDKNVRLAPYWKE